jgi:hypothetical protein
MNPINMDLTRLNYIKYPMNPINMDLTRLNYIKYPMNPINMDITRQPCYVHVNGFIGYLI